LVDSATPFKFFESSLTVLDLEDRFLVEFETLWAISASFSTLVFLFLGSTSTIFSPDFLRFTFFSTFGSSSTSGSSFIFSFPDLLIGFFLTGDSIPFVSAGSSSSSSLTFFLDFPL
jgi:hypothetical protein